MPPTSLDKMLETMMMQMMNLEQNAGQVCCLKKESQTCCKCGRNKPSKPKRRRKLRKSCLKTIICLSRAKREDECKDCTCDPCCDDGGIEANERYCSKCGQLLPGMAMPQAESSEYNQPVSQPNIPLHPSKTYYDMSVHQEQKDIGVQVNEPRDPLSVRIKVCPCPYSVPRSQHENLHHSVSLPELSKTNPRIVDDSTSDDLLSARAPRAHFEDNEPRQALNDPSEIRRSLEASSLNRLSLRMAKVRAIEDSAQREREDWARRHHQQQRERHVENKPPAVEDGRWQQRRPLEQGQEKLPNDHRGTYQANTNYNYYSTYAPMQGVPTGCCASTNVYCYSPEYGPRPFSEQCEPMCTCTGSQNESYSAYPYQPFPQQPYYGNYDRFYLNQTSGKADPAYGLSDSHDEQECSKRRRSPCR